MAEAGREFDVILWGATGYTGRLVAEHLLESYGAAGELRWALGGRGREKLEAVRAELGPAAAALPWVLADAGDAGSLAEMAGRARVVCSTVGPYARLGSELVAACARLGTDYCDLSGEVQWIRRMIDAHQEEAEAHGARIVPSCGFDSIPSDLGVLHLQNEMRARHGLPAGRVRCRVARFAGGFSGGSFASMIDFLGELASDPEVRRMVADPYALNPADRRSGPDGPDRNTPAFDEVFGQWTAPFVMGLVNTRVVRRSNALLGGAYGSDFRYDEAMLTGAGPAGWVKAAGVTAALAAATTAGAIGPLRRAVAGRLPAPGEGPSPEQREAGRFELLLHGAHPGDPALQVRTRVTGDRDPGYGATARMLGESAVCLARDPLPAAGGFWTPAAALGEPLLQRLRKRAGLTFDALPVPADPDRAS